jgi:hypothetical protein
MTQISTEQTRRPDLAVAGDQIAHGLRGGANQLHGLQNAGDVAAVLLELRHVFDPQAIGQQRVGNDLMTMTQLFDAFGQRRFLFLGRRDQVQQTIGHTTTGREHHAKPGMRVLLQDAGHALHANRIGDTRAAEFMYAPALHLVVSLKA